MITAAVRRFVEERADGRCEYCRFHQDDEPAIKFQIEHTIPRQHGGSDQVDNLALACLHCNSHKGPNLAGIDPETGEMVPLFNPRVDNWFDHFLLVSPFIVGQTARGRATVRVLQMNADQRVSLRLQL